MILLWRLFWDKESCFMTLSFIFSGKLKSRWTGSFIIHDVQSNGVVELLNFNSTRTFKVNGHRLKPYLESFSRDKEEFILLDPWESLKNEIMVKAVREPPAWAPLDAPPHLADSASQSRYHTRRASATPMAPTQIPPREHLGIHSLSRHPPGALDPVRPLRATQIADPKHFMSSHILSTLLCARLTWDSYTYLRGILGLDSCRGFPYPLCTADPTTFRRWVPLSEWDMRTIFRRELPPGMLLVDVVLRTNLFPLQHTVQRRGAILEALFRISEGYYFGPHHLIMAALLHFEEKVHKRRLRGDLHSITFPRSLCHVLAHMGFPADPQAEPRRHCRESFSLEHWTQLSLHQHSPELPEPREVPPAPSTWFLELCRQASSDAPPAVPPTAEPPITIPGSEYRALLASFQTLTTTQTAIMERMDHFQTQQDQQTLILRDIQKTLVLCHQLHHAVPSSPAEDPSYPPEEPTT
ncbi:hypothetical protein AAG906_019989 [Vitis piasezkii]